MKKILFLSMLISLSLLAFSESDIPNNSFENWDSTITSIPINYDMYMGISKQTNSYSGDFACKLINDAIKRNPGIVSFGQSEDGITFFGGTPYSQKPDSIKMFIKYSISTTDTARLLINFKKDGVIISNLLTSLPCGTSNDFVVFKKALNIPSTPDTVLFFIVNGDFTIDNSWNSSNWIIIDDITFYGINGNTITQQLPNNSFEDWDISKYYSLQNWGNSNERALERVQGSHGNYGLLIQNILSNNDTIYGNVNTIKSGNNNFNWKPTFKLTQTYDSLSIDFKYLPENNDSMRINVSLWKNNIPVGFSEFSTGETVSNWTTKKIFVFKQNGVIPDSATILISAYSTIGNNNKPKGNSKLYIDNINFFNSIATTINSNNNLCSNINIFPNPVNTISKIYYNIDKKENVSIEIFDITGKLLQTVLNENKEAGNYEVNINASELNKGIYLCRLKTESKSHIMKFLVVK